MTTVKKPPNGNATEWIKYLGAVSSMVVVVVLAPIAVWLVGSSIDHDRRLTKIESNRFTSADAMKVYEALASKADKHNVPPPEVKQALVRLERDVRDIKEAIAEHLRRVTVQHGGNN